MVSHRSRLDAVRTLFCEPEAHGDVLYRPAPRASRNTDCLVYLRQSLVCADALCATDGGTISARSSQMVVEWFHSPACEPRLCVSPGGALHTDRSMGRAG